MAGSYPTLSEVIIDAAQTHLADPQSTYYTSSVLGAPAIAAVRILFDSYRGIGAYPRLLRSVYLSLPAYQESIYLSSTATGNVPDMSQPHSLHIRTGVTEYTIAEINTTTKVITTSAAHGRSVGQMVTVSGTEVTAGGMSNSDGAYSVTAVPSSTTLTISGYAGDGTYGAGDVGKLRWSENNFVPCEYTNQTVSPRHDVDSQAYGVALPWTLRNNRIMLRPYSQDREVKLDYFSVGRIPSLGSDVVYIPGSITFLALMTAALATQRRLPALSQTLKAQAVGVSWPDTVGGALWSLLAAETKRMQAADVGENTYAFDMAGQSGSGSFYLRDVAD